MATGLIAEAPAKPANNSSIIPSPPAGKRFQKFSPSWVLISFLKAQKANGSARAAMRPTRTMTEKPAPAKIETIAMIGGAETSIASGADTVLRDWSIPRQQSEPTTRIIPAKKMGQPRAAASSRISRYCAGAEIVRKPQAKQGEAAAAAARRRRMRNVTLPPQFEDARLP
jgi:hypothetical protein